MSAAWTLIVLLIVPYGGTHERPAVLQSYFATRDQCEVARKTILDDIRHNLDATVVTARCHLMGTQGVPRQ